MARIPQPVETALLKGADKAHPERYRNRVRRSAPGIGEAPAYLSGDAAVVWLELAATLPPGVLTVADREAFAALCDLIAERREAPREFSGAKYSVLVSLLSRFGMTPSDRAKVQVTDEPEAPANPFTEFGNC